MLEKNFYNIKSLKKYKIIFGFFNRKNGFSKKNYKSLNCSFSSGDKKNLVKKNINQSLKKISLYNKKLIIPIQTHSSKIKKVKSYNILENIEADGLLTNNRKIALAVLTADCAPIMLFDKNEKIICCLHSGWRGSLNNIAGKGVKQLIKNKIKKNNIIAVIGPCLAKKNFEVSLDFKESFIKKNLNYKKFFSKKNKCKDLFDMRGLINFQLRGIGLKNIYNIKADTYSNKSIFYSHRRSLRSSQPKSGRMINIIGFK